MKRKLLVALLFVAVMSIGQINNTEAARVTPNVSGELLTFEPGDCTLFQPFISAVEVRSRLDWTMGVGILNSWAVNPNFILAVGETSLMPCPPPESGIGFSVCGYIYISFEPGSYDPPSNQNFMHQVAITGNEPPPFKNATFYKVGDTPLTMCITATVAAAAGQTEEIIQPLMVTRVENRELTFDDWANSGVLPSSPAAFAFFHPFVCGDLNNDEAVNIFDAILTLQILIDLIHPTAKQRVLGDVVEDGYIDIFDAILILQHSVGLVTITDCGEM